MTKQCGTSLYVENVHFVPDLLVSISRAIQLIPFTKCRASCPQNCIFWLVNVSFLTDLLDCTFVHADLRTTYRWIIHIFTSILSGTLHAHLAHII